MFKEFQYKDIDDGKIHGENILIDVRSPYEYKNATIPGAINIPIFNDEERKTIGTIYVQESVEKAKRIGIGVASKKLPDIYDKVANLNKEYDHLIFFCAKGGFRSTSVASLFSSIGINAFKIDGGYKKYRKYINNALPKTVENIKFVVLYGNTGTGKTHILEEIEKMGPDILDLEACANHRGSLLGSVGLGEQNSQKQFESLLYESLKNRKSNLVFVEGESKRIGKVIIPNYIYNAMNNGIHIKIEANMEYRVNNIMKDYVHETDDELISSLNLLRKYMGNRKIDNYIDLINENKYEEVIEELMVKYYDPRYENNNRDIGAVFYNENSKDAAREIVTFIKKLLQCEKQR